MRIVSDLKAARKVEEKIFREITRHHYSEEARFAIKLALEEGLNNAIKHGNALDATKNVVVAYEVTDQSVSITITDEGKGFKPECVPDPTADENLERPCGRGIMLMRAYMDEVRYNPCGNQVFMLKHNR